MSIEKNAKDKLDDLLAMVFSGGSRAGMILGSDRLDQVRPGIERWTRYEAERGALYDELLKHLGANSKPTPQRRTWAESPGTGP